MANGRFDIQRMNQLKDILLRLNNGEPSESVRIEIENYFKDARIVDILLTEQELINGTHGITIADVIQLSSILPHLYSNSLNEDIIMETSYSGHPVQVLKDENKVFQFALNQLNFLFEAVKENAQGSKDIKKIDEIRRYITQLGEFHKHFHRKEKLYFPLMERYGYFDPPKIMWRADDRIRSLYKALTGQMNQFPNLEFKHIKNTYITLEKEFKEMIFHEEAIFLPVLQSIFNENDWLRIAEESDAFGYALKNVAVDWLSKVENQSIGKNREAEMDNVKQTISTDKSIPFGGGYLTIEEANLILNNLPLEITFVDKNSVFKYFNTITKSSDMMLVRTPISIGRNVANCHPPSSLSKVMTLVRDLKAKRRASESMWFKMKGQYIHLTYKPLFNDEDEFLGILEYVQNIQPFFELPSEIKRSLSKLEE